MAVSENFDVSVIVQSGHISYFLPVTVLTESNTGSDPLSIGGHFTLENIMINDYDLFSKTLNIQGYRVSQKKVE